MKNSECWEKFTRTGSISDYLNYTACTIENLTGYTAREKEEGGFSGSRNDGDRTGIIGDAHWGI